MYFIGNDEGPSIEDFLKSQKSEWKEQWKFFLHICLREDSHTWWNSLSNRKMMALSDEEFEKVLLEKWPHAKIKERNKGLFSCGNSILQVHGCIHKENIIVSINPSFLHNFINVKLVNRLQVPTKNIQSTQVEGENV
jgi:hypothetical protein